MYKVVINHDTETDRSYFYYNAMHENENYDIEVEDLPPYADLIKARACYYENEEWIFDNDKYLRNKQQLDESIEMEKLIQNTPDNVQLTAMVMELASMVSDLYEKIEG